MSEQIREQKRQLRRALRAIRAGVDPTGERTAQLWSHVRAVPAVREAKVVMAYDAVGGEPVADRFVVWCRSLGKTVVVPASERTAEYPVDPDVPDVVVVPGLAFTPLGARLGQGGGWYDRFLAETRADCLTIGVAFVEQIVDDLPIERHDVFADLVVTDVGPVGSPSTPQKVRPE